MPFLRKQYYYSRFIYYRFCFYFVCYQVLQIVSIHSFIYLNLFVSKSFSSNEITPYDKYVQYSAKKRFSRRKEIGRALLVQTVAFENRSRFHYRSSWRRERECASSAFKSNSKSAGQCKLLFTAWGCGRRRIGRSWCAANFFEWCANSLPFCSLFLSPSTRTPRQWLQLPRR